MTREKMKERVRGILVSNIDIEGGFTHASPDEVAEEVMKLWDQRSVKELEAEIERLKREVDDLYREMTFHRP